MMRIHVITANFNGFKKAPLKIKSDKHSISIANYNDTNTASRSLAMHPRFKSKIPKMLEWKKVKADWYIWIDASFHVVSTDLVSDVLKAAGKNKLCFYRHNKRNSIKQECEFMTKNIKNGSLYLYSRYSGEPFEEQVKHYLSDKSFKDTQLFATGFFAYHSSMSHVMEAWFLELAEWTIQDQLSLPYILHKYKARYSIFKEGDILKNPYVQHDIENNKTFSKKISYQIRNLWTAIKSLKA
jgi:hypothetical protein